jgi:hypothetical protein
LERSSAPPECFATADILLINVHGPVTEFNNVLLIPTRRLVGVHRKLIWVKNPRRGDEKSLKSHKDDNAHVEQKNWNRFVPKN